MQVTLAPLSLRLGKVSFNDLTSAPILFNACRWAALREILTVPPSFAVLLAFARLAIEFVSCWGSTAKRPKRPEKSIRVLRKSPSFGLAGPAHDILDDTHQLFYFLAVL